MKAAVILFLMALSGQAAAHSFNPPYLQAIYVNGVSRVTANAVNVNSEAQKYELQVFTSIKDNIQYPQEFWSAVPADDFWISAVNTRSVVFQFIDHDDSPSFVWICSTSIPEVSEGQTQELVTRVCAVVNFFRMGPKPNAKA